MTHPVEISQPLSLATRSGMMNGVVKVVRIKGSTWIHQYGHPLAKANIGIITIEYPTCKQ